MNAIFANEETEERGDNPLPKIVVHSEAGFEFTQSCSRV